MARAQAASNVEEQIEHLYDEIIALTRQSAPGEEAKLSSKLARAYSRLLELQATAAKDYRNRFEASLQMPLDAGKKLLARARTLRAELEDLASSDPASYFTQSSRARAKTR